MTAQTETPLHFVTVKHTRDDEGDVERTEITFECRGDRTSWCHIYPDCECESWDEEHDREHPSVPHDDCTVQDWFDAGVDTTYYDGDDGDSDFEWMLPERSGPIEIEWDECPVWRWADEVTS